MKKEELITERVKTFKDACIELDEPMLLPWVKYLHKRHRRAITAYYKLMLITEALNEG